MNENVKTVAFAAVAALVVLIVWAVQPTVTGDEQTDLRGQLLFPKFRDPLAAISLTIIKHDEDTGDVIPFEVGQVDGIWSIPSHENYPADAKDHLAEAATSLMDLKILAEVSDNPGDFEEYGVLDPADKDLRPGAAGVGMRVTMKGKDNKTLVALIIGKKDPEQPELRYARRVDQNAVFSVAVSTDKLTTRFEDWIEEDLLKLEYFDVEQIDIQDYSIDEARGALMQRGRMSLTYDDSAETDKKWKLASDEAFQNGKWTDLKLADDEELDTDKLNDAKSALDDLKIVDVARKPAGLSADLKAAKTFANNQEAVGSLAQRGFYMAAVEGKPGIYSNEGDIRCLMKDGVEYVLRFGNIAGTGNVKEEEKDDEKQQEDSGSTGLNRYIFVMAEFNPDVIAKPELEPLPEEKPAAKTDQKPDAKQPKSEKTDAPKTENEKSTEKSTDEAKTKKEQPDDKKPDDKKQDESELKAERERIEKDNKRKQDEYNEKIEKGQKKVKQLNARFADWYYVISDSVYKKIHLGRKDIVKKKEKEEKEGEGENKDDDKKNQNDKKDEPDKHTPNALDKIKEKGLEEKNK